MTTLTRSAATSLEMEQPTTVSNFAVQGESSTSHPGVGLVILQPETCPDYDPATHPSELCEPFGSLQASFTSA